MSSISLSPVSLDDVDAASDCAWEAFQGNEAMRPHFPNGGHNSPEVKQWKADILRRRVHYSKDARCVKAVDSAHPGVIVGFAVYQRHKPLHERAMLADGTREPPTDFVFSEERLREPLPPGCNRESMKTAESILDESSDDLLGEEPYLYLQTFCTHPGWQRRGVGSLLVEWGLQQAAAEGIRVYLEATPAGKKFYERHGFRVLRDLELPGGGILTQMISGPAS